MEIYRVTEIADGQLHHFAVTIIPGTGMFVFMELKTRLTCRIYCVTVSRVLSHSDTRCQVLLV